MYVIQNCHFQRTEDSEVEEGIRIDEGTDSIIIDLNTKVVEGEIWDITCSGDKFFINVMPFFDTGRGFVTRKKRASEVIQESEEMKNLRAELEEERWLELW